MPAQAVVLLSHDYPASPEAVWRVACDWRCLVEASRGLLRYDDAPQGRLVEGQDVALSLSFLGVFPPTKWRIEIALLDDQARVMRSLEGGAPVRRWEHWMTVTPIEHGARLTDRIEIEAGVLTPAYAAFAKMLYNRRHPRRRRMLDD
jgi:ligand-binding SRPBCC domain-containing protein